MVMDCRRSCSTDGVSDDDEEEVEGEEEEEGEDDNDDAHAQRTGSVPDLKK